MSGYIESTDLAPNLPQTCFCRERPLQVNGGVIKFDGRRVYFELDPRTQIKIEAVLRHRVPTTYNALPIRRNWTPGIVPVLGGGFDPNGVYVEPTRLPPRLKWAWTESMRPRDRFDFRDFLNSVDEMNLRYDDPTPQQREENQARDSEAFLRLNANKPWYVGAGFTRVRPDGEFDERGRFVFEVLVLKGHLDEAKRDLPVIHQAGGPDIHKFRGFPIVFRESGPIVALKDGGGMGSLADSDVLGGSRGRIGPDCRDRDRPLHQKDARGRCLTPVVT